MSFVSFAFDYALFHLQIWYRFILSFSCEKFFGFRFGSPVIGDWSIWLQHEVVFSISRVYTGKLAWIGIGP